MLNIYYKLSFRFKLSFSTGLNGLRLERMEVLRVNMQTQVLEKNRKMEAREK